MGALHRVLVVDDDPVVATSFDRVLTREGYAVVTARDGQEALDKLNQGDYDVVFTDIRMPGMDGLELAEKVRARRTWTPVVIITGYGSAANETRARAAGVSAFLHKPVSPELIEASARQAMLAPPPALLTPAPAAAEAPAATEAPAGGSRLQFAALLLAAPLIGLAYIVLAPFAGLAALAWMGARAFVRAGGLSRSAIFLKNVGLFVAAPFLGLAYIVLLPFVGLGTLVWMGLRGLTKKRQPG